MVRLDHRTPGNHWTHNRSIVTELQKLMLDAGADLGPKKADGDFGHFSRAAYKQLSSEQQSELLKTARQNAKNNSAAINTPAPVQPPPTPSASEALTPTLAPLSSESRGTIVIDPGHGGLSRTSSSGYDLGAQGKLPDGTVVTEVEANWKLALDVKKALEAKHFTVVLTKPTMLTDLERAADPDGRAVSQGLRRTSIDPKAMAYISIHHDIRPSDKKYNGMVVNSSQNARTLDEIFGTTLAQAISGRYHKNEKSLAVLNPNNHAANCTCPLCRNLPPGIGLQQAAVIIESANLANPADAALAMNDDARQKKAQVIADGIEKTLETPRVQQAMMVKPKAGAVASLGNLY
jgi:N-acetylmuramoyl-L-alanine amidase